MWRKVRLGDICTIVNGGTPKSNVKDYWDGNIKWLTPKDMGKLQDKYVRNTERQITADGLANSSAKLVPKNSIILSCRAPIGHVFINDCEMSFNQGCKGLIPGKDLLVEYLYYFLFASKKLLNDLGTGTTFKEISGKTLSNVTISLPPLAEQQRIVAKLDAAFAEIDRAIELNNWRAEQSKRLLQRIIDNEFSSKSDSVNFDSIVKIKGTGLERRANLQSSDKEFPYLKMNNISSANTLNLEDFTAVDASDDEVNKYTLEDGDFLFNTRNSVELVGKSAVVRGLEGWLFNNNILRVKFSEKINPDYVNDFFCSSVGKKQLEDRKTGTTNVAAIYYKDLKTVEIPIISIEEQIEIASKIEKARTLNASLQKNYSSAIEQLSALKSALLAQELQPSEAA